MAIQVSPLPTIPAGPVEVAIVASTISPDDFRSRHKTSDRAFHDAPRKAAGTFEIAFVDAHGFLTEGSFTSLFVERGDTLVTRSEEHTSELQSLMRTSYALFC